MTYDLHIDGPIGYWITAESVRYRLEALASSKDGGGKGDKDTTIHVRICSPGGSLSDGLAICALLRDHGHVHAHIQGMTASAATVLAMGCARITMTPESVMLIHNASYMLSEWEQANKERLAEKQAEYDALRKNLATLDATMARLYSARTGRTEAEMAKLMGEERWLTAQEALDLGLIDAIEAVADGSCSASASLASGCATPEKLVAAFCAGYGLPSFAQEPSGASIPSAERPSFFDKLTSLFTSSSTMTKEELQALTAERDTLKTQCEEAQAQTADLEKRFADASKTITDLETQVQALTTERDTLKEQLDAVTAAQASADGAVTTQVDPIAEQPEDSFLSAVAEARTAVALFG